MKRPKTKLKYITQGIKNHQKNYYLRAYCISYYNYMKCATKNEMWKIDVSEHSKPMDNKTGMETKNWSIYMVRNNKNDLYTGISIDVALRFEKHKSGKGAKFLKTKHPLSLVYQCQVESQSEALSFEYKIKKLKKIQKEQLVKDQPPNVVEYIKTL